jgi:hypothetical protein
MARPDDESAEVPDGAAIFPEIPAELGVNPLWLAVLHTTVFLLGSDEGIVDPEAAEDAAQGVALYLGRLEGAELQRVREDMACLIAYARQQKWPKGLVLALKTFLADLGLEEEGEAE